MCGHFMCGNWWFVPMIFFGLMMVGCLIFFLRGGFGRRRHTGRYRSWCWDGPAALESPLDLLKARYARGEIDKEEYEGMRDTLTGEDSR